MIILQNEQINSNIINTDNIPVPAAVQIKTYYAAVVETLTDPMNYRSMQPP
jgi:hypothetical protein